MNNGNVIIIKIENEIMKISMAKYEIGVMAISWRVSK
jgi:hypothetical protein